MRATPKKLEKLGFFGRSLSELADDQDLAVAARLFAGMKRALRTLDVVVTAVEWGHGKRHALLSDHTFAVRDGAVHRNRGARYWRRMKRAGAGRTSGTSRSPRTSGRRWVRA